MASEFDRQREQVRSQIAEHQREASEAFNDLVSAASAQVRETWATGIRHYVEKIEPERTQELGPGVVSSLKADLADLDAHAPSIVQAELDKLPAWNAYRADQARDFPDDAYSGFLNFHSSYMYSYPRRLPSNVVTALDSAVERADEILHNNGWDNAGNSPYRGGRRLALIRLPQDPTPEMLDAMSAFSLAADRIAKARKALKAIDTAESEDRAKSIWDEA